MVAPKKIPVKKATKAPIKMGASAMVSSTPKMSDKTVSKKDESCCGV